MKLDHNCVRDVLLLLESVPNYTVNPDGEVENNGIWFEYICDRLPRYPQETIYYTLSKLSEGGYVNMATQWNENALGDCCVNDITYRGHEFLETIRPETVWEKTTAAAAKVGSFGLRMLEKVAESIAAAYFKDALL